MRAAGALLGLVIVLAVGYWLYRMEVTPSAAQGATAPVEQIDTTGVTSDLISIGQAEKLYLASHDTYATLDQLQQEGSISFGSRRGYNYAVQVDGQRFQAVATPADSSKAGWPTFLMDQTLQVSRQ
jgi:hypothetical protein